MRSKLTAHPLVAFSTKLYSMLLAAYPTRFRQDYGSHMVQLFEDCSVRAVQHGGTNALVRLCVATFLDYAQSVISEHAHKEIEMKTELKPESVQAAGSALVAAGGVCFLSIAFFATKISGLWAVSFLLLVYISMPLLVVGLLGLRKRYGEQVGWFGRNILLFGAIVGPLTSLYVLIGNLLAGWMWLSGHAVLLACLALFGFVALYTKPLPRWNVVPFIAGIWYPFVFWSAGITQHALDWELPPIGADIAILFGVQGIALAALGYILKSDVPKVAAAPALEKSRLR